MLIFRFCFAPPNFQVEQLESIVPGLRAANTDLDHAKIALQKDVESLKLELHLQGESLESERQNLSKELNEAKTRFLEKQGKLETTIENLRARSVEAALTHNVAHALTLSYTDNTQHTKERARARTIRRRPCTIVHNTVLVCRS